MVTLSQVQASNARISSTLPPGLVAVFVGATSGIGETSLKQFAKHTRRPRIYFVGRSEKAGERISTECKALNAEGEYIFIKADLTLITAVDEVCKEIKKSVKTVNLLFLSIGSFSNSETTEGLQSLACLVHYSRARFIVNLLPLLRQAAALRRVVSVFAATKEGPVDSSDWQLKNLPAYAILKQRGHAASMVTLDHEAIAQTAPEVSFIHDFPGPVRSNLARAGQGAAVSVIRLLFKAIAPLVYIPTVESGDRHVYLATSARYPAAAGGKDADGVPLTEGEEVAKGTDGKIGSGVYSVDQNGESAGDQVIELLAGFRRDGIGDKLWKHTEEEFRRITGQVAV